MDNHFGRIIAKSQTANSTIHQNNRNVLHRCTWLRRLWQWKVCLYPYLSRHDSHHPTIWCLTESSIGPFITNCIKWQDFILKIRPPPASVHNYIVATRFPFTVGSRKPTKLQQKSENFSTFIPSIVNRWNRLVISENLLSCRKCSINWIWYYNDRGIIKLNRIWPNWCNWWLGSRRIERYAIYMFNIWLNWMP